MTGRGPAWLEVPLGSRRVSTNTGREAGRVRSFAAALVGALGAVVLIVLPWAFQRLTVRDPTRSVPGWQRRSRVAPPGDRQTLDRMVFASRTRADSVRRFVAFGAVTALLLVLTTPGQAIVSLVVSGKQIPGNAFRLSQQVGIIDEGLPPLEHPAPPGLTEDNPVGNVLGKAQEGDEDWVLGSDFANGQGWVFDITGAWTPTNPYRSSDFEASTFHVINGTRSSWTPPTCDCERVTIWMYGGSTTMGINQRDEHTIASELARAAHADGIQIDILNRGQMGQLHWQEAERFRLDLLVDEPPDLVVFYDGVNDGWAANEIGARGTDFAPPIDPTLVGAWDNTGRSNGEPPSPPPNAKFLGWGNHDGLTVDQRARVTVERYDRSRKISADAAARAGVVSRYVWQPSRFSRDFQPEEPHGTTDQENASRMTDQLIADVLPSDVIDLIDVFDGYTEPLFTDDVHHNETGAAIVGEALYLRLERDLRRVLEARQAGS